jgi:outer membrane protein assembly complex protein YaeT
MRPLFGLLLLLALAGCSSGDKQEKPPPPEETVVFEGATAISEGDLRELVARDVKRFKTDGRTTALDDAGFRIEYQYRLEGYHRVRVIPRVDKDHVVFTIEEGPRIHLGFVHFEGATVFKPEELRQLVPGRFLGDAPPYSIRLAIQIEEGIIASYRDRGFADAAVQRRAQPDGDRMNLTYVVDEGKPYVVTEIRKLPSDPKLQEKTAAALGRPFTPGTAETIEATIVDFYRETGHPFATARLKPQPDRETGTVVMEADVRDGPDVHIGALNISGTVWSRSSFVANRVDIEPGKQFKASDLRRAEERLIATNVYKRVRVSPGTFQEETGTVPLDVVLEERETGEAALRGGYGSFEGVRGGADLIGVNIWGGAESIRIGGNISKVGYRGEGDLGVPYLFGSELRMGIAGHYESREYPSYDAVSRGGVLSFSYPWSTKLSTTIGIRHADILTSNVDPSVPPGDLLDYNYTAVFFTPTLDLRDSALAPTQGILLTGEFAYAPSSFLTDIQFWSASGRFSYFFPFPEGIVFATSFQGGVIAPIAGTDEIPIALRYFCGGTNTVRGFKFEAIGPKGTNGDPTGGQVFLALQSEVRFPIWGSLQGAFFSDQGGVWFDRLHVHLPDIRYSVGAGIRFLTPAGALVADVGWNPHPKGNEYPTEFHLSVGFPF